MLLALSSRKSATTKAKEGKKGRSSNSNRTKKDVSGALQREHGCSKATQPTPTLHALTTQHNTTQHNTTQPNTTQHNTTQARTFARFLKVLCNTRAIELLLAQLPRCVPAMQKLLPRRLCVKRHLRGPCTKLLLLAASCGLRCLPAVIHLLLWRLWRLWSAWSECGCNRALSGR